MSHAWDARTGGESREALRAAAIFPEDDATLLRDVTAVPGGHPDYALPAAAPSHVAFHLNNELAPHHAAMHGTDLPHPPVSWQARRDAILARLAAHAQIPQGRQGRRSLLLAVLFGLAGIAAIVTPFIAGDRIDADRVFTAPVYTDRVYTDRVDTRTVPAPAESVAAPGADVRPQIMEMLLREMSEDDADIATPAAPAPPAPSPRPDSCPNAVRALALCDMQDTR